MGTEYTKQLNGPVQEAQAQNAAGLQMQNVARGQDPNANGFGDINTGKTLGAPAKPRPGIGRPMGPSPLASPGGGGNPAMGIAQALMAMKQSQRPEQS